MDAKTMWNTVHAERQALVKDLKPVGDEKWSSPSGCERWTIQQTIAHMTATASMTPLSFFPKFVAAGFSLTRENEKGIVTASGSSPADTLAKFEAVVTSTKRPPGPRDTMLGETLVHAEDVRRPLGITHSYPIEMVTHVADFFKGQNLVIGAKRRIAGITLRANDADWTWGSGPEVSGPMMSILLAMTGRKSAINDLAGEGVETLRGRP